MIQEKKTLKPRRWERNGAPRSSGGTQCSGGRAEWSSSSGETTPNHWCNTLPFFRNRTRGPATPKGAIISTQIQVPSQPAAAPGTRDDEFAAATGNFAVALDWGGTLHAPTQAGADMLILPNEEEEEEEEEEEVIG